MKIIDSHAHIAHWPTLKESESQLLRSMKEKDIAFSLISDCDCSEYPSLDQYKPHPVTALEGLKHCLTLANKFPTHIGVLVWINPHHERLTPELIRCIHENNRFIYGYKFHPWESQMRITHPRLTPYLRFISLEKKPLLVHTAKDRYSSIRYLGMAASRFPRIHFVAAHLELCTDDKDEAIRVLKTHPNIDADTAWVKMSDAKRVIDEVGPNRILFGTDNPVDGEKTLDNPLYEEYFSNALDLSGKEWRALMGGNAAKLYGIHFPERKKTKEGK
ncbi:MAG: TatD family hydrolase [Erysipelotrichaceae bacterium]|nr:TatD family hydrolase [Erysipelotrichaceae bacterium]